MLVYHDIVGKLSNADISRTRKGIEPLIQWSIDNYSASVWLYTE